MTKDRVRRIIGLIGKKADVEDQVEDTRTQHRVKYASAHDIRRGLAHPRWIIEFDAFLDTPAEV